VGLGIPDTTTDDGGTDKTGRTDGDSGEGNGGQELSNLDGHLVRAVGEVVVTSGHEVEGTSGLGLDGTSVEERRGHVEVVAVLVVLLVVGNLSVRLAATLLSGGGANVRLVEVSELVGGGGREELNVLKLSGVVGSGLVALLGQDRHQVGTISLILSVTSLTSGVVVRTSPLEVDIVSASDLEVVGGEIVLNAGVSLDNVSTASTDGQVEDTSSRLDVSWALHNLEGVRAVLEGTTELGGVDIDGQVASLTVVGINTEANLGVSLDGGLLTIEGGIDHLTLALINVSEGLVVTRGDVVADTEDASSELFVLVEVDVGDDPLIGLSHDGTVDVDITQVVIAALSGSEAVRGGDSPVLDLDPLVAVLGAGSLVPITGLAVPKGGNIHSLTPIHVGLGGISADAESLGFNILGLLAVPITATRFGSQDSDILPGGGCPVGVVVPLLGALETVASSTIVLTSTIGSSVSSKVVLTISEEETLVARASTASDVPAERLVLTTVSANEGVIRIIHNIDTAIVGTNSVSSILLGTITNPGTAHVLEDHVTVDVVVVLSAAVLDGPLNLEQRAFVVGHGAAPLVAALGIVLRIEQAVLVLGIRVLFIELVVRSTRSMAVAVTENGGDQSSQN